MWSVCRARVKYILIHMKYILIQDAYDLRCGLCMYAGKEEEEGESKQTTRP